jgi:hypothetical protein
LLLVLLPRVLLKSLLLLVQVVVLLQQVMRQEPGCAKHQHLLQSPLCACPSLVVMIDQPHQKLLLLSAHSQPQAQALQLERWLLSVLAELLPLLPILTPSELQAALLALQKVLQA